MSQENSGSKGNTSNLTPPDIRGRNWCFTCNNWTEDDLSQLKSFLSFHETIKYAFQSEVGASGTKHIQGAIGFKWQMRFSTLKLEFSGWHWEKMKSTKHAYAYCYKQDSWDGEVRESKGLPGTLVLLSPLAGKQWYPFQLEVKSILSEVADDRKIHWFWEKNGCAGKTSIAKHMCIINNTIIYLNGGAKDIKCGVQIWMEKHAGTNPGGFIFGFPRSTEDRISYAAIEELKDGIFFSSKYESGMVMFNPVPIICFANFAPKTNELSSDRWIIHDLNEYTFDGMVA